MLTEKSKTLREFYFNATTKAGEALVVSFGYDLSGIHSGFFASVSVNGALESSTRSALAKAESLKIPALNALIEAIGTDVTGAYQAYEADFKAALKSYAKNASKTTYKKMVDLNRITKNEDSVGFQKFLREYKQMVNKGDVRKAASLTKNYIIENYLRFLDLTKSVVTGIRQLVMQGALVNGNAINVNFTRIPVARGTVDAFNSAYYKRDIDSLRKARMSLYKKWGKKYVPASVKE